MKGGVFKTINNQNKSITPFKVFKTWNFTSSSSLDDAGIDRLIAIKPDMSKYSGKLVTLDSFQTLSDTGSYLINVADNKPASVIWYSLNHLYYKNDHSPNGRTLYDTAAIFSVPQKLFGESIKPNSVNIQYGNVSIVDDGFSNLIDTNIAPGVPHEVLYLNLDVDTYEPNYSTNTSSSNAVFSDSTLYKIKTRSKSLNLDVVSKYVLINPVSLPGAVAGKFAGNSGLYNGNSYIRIKNEDSINFKQSQNFSVAFWIKPSTSGYVLTKRYDGTGNNIFNGLTQTTTINTNSSQYPFECYVDYDTVLNKYSLSFKYSSGYRTYTLNSGLLTSIDPHHVVFQKNGVVLEFWIDGILTDSITTDGKGNIHNKADILIGSQQLDSNGDGMNGFTGYLSHFFLFNKSLDLNEVGQLYITDTCNNTNVVGNVFYEHGIIVISDPRPQYSYKYITNNVLQSAIDNTYSPTEGMEFTLSYKSTVTIREHEYTCIIREDEFNFTNNATIRMDDDLNSQIAKSFVYKDGFTPYITTVGLYTPNGDLVAVGKLSSPIKKRDNVDLNIVVRFDT